MHTVRRGPLTLFTAAPPTELIARLRKQYNAPLDFLEEELPQIQGDQPEEPFLTVSGVNAIRDTATALIDGAAEEIHLSCWEVDADALRSALADATSRDVKVFGMLYGESEPPAGQWLRHHYDDIVSRRVGGRLLALVADEREALIATIPTSNHATAVRSRNPVMTLVVREYLHHDNLLQRVQLSIGFEEWDRWWQGDPDVRAEILGRAAASDDSAASRRDRPPVDTRAIGEVA